MDLKSFIERGKIDWRAAYFIPDSGTGFDCGFAIKPEDFITFAKADFFRADVRGLVNALSNAKRAIDCQADTFISGLGLDPDKLDKQLGPKGLASLCYGNSLLDGPVKLRFLQALGVATPSIVSRIRRLRNSLEHDYTKPRRGDVNDAIGVAELFVQALHGKMRSLMGDFAFGSGSTDARGTRDVARQFYVQLETGSKLHITVTYWDQIWIAKNGAGKCPSITLRPNDCEFIPLLKIISRADWGRDMTEPFKTFASELGLSIPAKGFRVREWCR